MKKLFVDARPNDRDLIIAALEAGADAVLVNSAKGVFDLGLITTIAPDGSLIPGTDIFEITISDADSQNKAMDKNGTLIVHTSDWTIIPLENLIAAGREVIAAVSSLEEAKTALTVLETGVSGVLVKGDESLIREVAGFISHSGARVSLVEMEVKSIKPVGMGDRVCIDTCTNMVDGQGMLIGNTSSGMMLVSAETLDNPYVAKRPFRVNAGAVHSYIQVTDGKTAYLSDLKSGDKTLVINSDGDGFSAVIGRIKIEKRPLLLIEAMYKDQLVSAILQNAETIRIITPDGAVPVTKLHPGVIIKGAVMEGGRHFGMPVKESITEK